MDSLTSFIAGLVMTASATSMTGGVQATEGQTITTGDSYSSVRVENTINAGNGGGSSQTVIKTNVNGVENTEVHNDPVPASGTVIINTATSSSSKGTISGARVQVYTQGSTTSSTSIFASSTASSSVNTKGLGARITTEISRMFKNFFLWWGFTR